MVAPDPAKKPTKVLVCLEPNKNRPAGAPTAHIRKANKKAHQNTAKDANVINKYSRLDEIYEIVPEDKDIEPT